MSDMNQPGLFDEVDTEALALQLQFSGEGERGPESAVRVKRYRIEPPPPFDEDRVLANLKAAHQKSHGNTDFNCNWLRDGLNSARIAHEAMVERCRVSSAQFQLENEIRQSASTESAESKKLSQWGEYVGADAQEEVSYPVGNAYPLYHASQLSKAKETRLEEWYEATKKVLDSICPQMQNAYCWRDARISHHGLHAKNLLSYGKFVVRNIIDSGCSNASKAESEYWYESFVSLVMAIIKGDNSGNCYDVYRAYASVTKAPKYTSGCLLVHYAAYRNYLNSTFAMALYQHRRDYFVTKAVVATAHAKVTNHMPQSISKGLTDAAKVVAGQQQKKE